MRARVLVPIAVIALFILLVSTIVAIQLFGQQAEVTGLLRENIDSRRAALDLEECLKDVITLEDDRVETVNSLHTRLLAHIRDLKALADQDTEKSIAREIETGFAKYLAMWRALPPENDPSHESARVAATRTLEEDVLRPCEQFQTYNAQRIDQSVEHYDRQLRRLAWGMGAFGTLVAVAGLIFGFGYARSLSQTVHSLNVQLKNVSERLGPAPAEMIISRTSDWADLHAEADRLGERVERIVSELAQRNQEITRAEQLAAVGQLAAGVAHEIRNPLTSVKLLVQSSLKTKQPLPVDDLSLVESEIRRVEASLQSFLDFARPPKLERRPVDVRSLTGQVLELVRASADSRGVTIRLIADEPAILFADEGQLRQVLLNLTRNALDALIGGGSIDIRIIRDQISTTIEVEDNGPGISSTMLSKLFEPFASEKETGLGLGLVTCQRIIQDHGGTITGRNRSTGGALFRMTIPHENPSS